MLDDRNQWLQTRQVLPKQAESSAIGRSGLPSTARAICITSIGPVKDTLRSRCTKAGTNMQSTFREDIPHGWMKDATYMEGLRFRPADDNQPSDGDNWERRRHRVPHARDDSFSGDLLDRPSSRSSEVVTNEELPGYYAQVWAGLIAG